MYLVKGLYFISVRFDETVWYGLHFQQYFLTESNSEKNINIKKIRFIDDLTKYFKEALIEED